MGEQKDTRHRHKLGVGDRTDYSLFLSFLILFPYLSFPFVAVIGVRSDGIC